MSGAPDFQYDAKPRDTSIPRFYIEAQRNEARSEKEGRPCFDDVEMVEILIPGDRNAISNRIVTDEHRTRWPESYKRFKADQDAPIDGTPIDQLPGVTRSQVEELKFMHVHSVEAMAALSDDQLRKAVSMGGTALRDRAIRWLAATEGNAEQERLAAENRAQKETIADLTRKLEDLSEKVSKLAVPKEEAAGGPEA